MSDITSGSHKDTGKRYLHILTHAASIVSMVSVGTNVRTYMFHLGVSHCAYLEEFVLTKKQLSTFISIQNYVIAIS